jgi:hypothetical protein
MLYQTYVNKLTKAYNDTELYLIATDAIAFTLIDTHKAYRNRLPVKQVIKTLASELTKSDWDYTTIQAALYEGK